MKKVLTFILCFLFIGIVKAETCVVVSGDGTNYGDEVKCGTEYFYVLERTDTTTKLFAKYNLMVGDEINYFEADPEEPKGTFANYQLWQEAVENYCNSLAEEHGYDPYLVYPMFDMDEGTLKGCRAYQLIDEEHIRQNEKAVGTVIINGKSKLPLYGITYMVPEWGYEAIVNNNIKENEYNRKGNLIVEGSSFEEYINGYKDELTSQGINVKNVSFITLDGVLNFLEAVTGEEIEINLEYDYDDYNQYDPESFTLKMNLKDYIPDKYSWLYSTTYWLGSGFYISDFNGVSNSQYNDFYISNEGILCALGRGECGYFAYPIGNGLRPVVTVNNSEIDFIIETKTDGNGEVKAEKVKAKGGEVVKFTVTPNKGYVLGEVKVTDANGNVITFTKDELKGNSFTMPNANVLIEATFVVNNAKTATFISVMVIVIEVIAFFTILIMNKKIKKIEQ